jgi:hypothetical protein
VTRVRARVLGVYPMTAQSSIGNPITLPGEEGDPPTLSPADRVLVDFAGHEAGIGELSWGQRDIWLAMARQGDWMPLGGTRPVEQGTTVQQVADELRYLMTRFPVLRTRLRPGADGRAVQELFGSGEIALELFDAEDHADAYDGPQTVAAAVEAQYRCTAFNFADHWPVRMALVRNHGVPTHLVAIICHLALDSVGAQVMLREVEARQSAPTTGMQPLEQARWQRSPAGERQNTAALRYWENLMRQIPPRRIPLRRIPAPAGPRRPRRWCAEFASPALRLAMRAIAQRTAADSSTVLLALYSVALARITGVNPVVTRPLVGNRFRAGLADVVCSAVQGGICALDIADVTVDQAVRRAQRATMAAYKHAYYDPERLQELIARVAGERGPDFEIGCFFNDRRVQSRQDPAEAPCTPRRLRDALTHSAFRWSAKQDEDPDEVMFVHIDDLPDGVLLTICADTGYFGSTDIEALGRGMEAVAAEAAFDPAAPTRVAPPPGL